IIIYLFAFSSCEKEENVVSNIQSLHFVIEDGILNIYPIFGENDNCTYTIVYSLDDTEIGRVRSLPYELEYELKPEDLATGDHFILVEFYGKHSGKYSDLYIEKKLSVKYSILGNGTVENGDVETIE
ncbi:MAG: hypothetical protein Q4D36_00250, partial [Bacteroidales bacterium]|nr:hypothetical protein [Bacteroidales bacterium]